MKCMYFKGTYTNGHMRELLLRISLEDYDGKVVGVSNCRWG